LKRNIYADFSYLLVLAASFGAVIVLGAFVAPVIFHTDRLLSEVVIDNYNAGIIMAEIFRRFGYWANFLALFVLIYEIVKYKSGQRDSIIIVSSIMTVFASFMFSVVYAPRILEMQALGAEATQSDTFEHLHLASEIDFKFLAISLIVLFVRRLMLMRID
jgi:cellulose synthase/poly-beta-1,6-N-acetylglucosamine synthase-like glycosyltransferase